MAPKYILHYFDFKGRAEGIRYMLHYKNVDYEDRRIAPVDWAAIKSQMPAGQVPVLEKDGCKLTQSVSIARYIGHELGLYPSGAWENAKLDEIVDFTSDALTDVVRWRREKDEKKQEEIRKELESQTLPPHLNLLVRLMNLSEAKPFLGGKKPVWADFFIAARMEFVDSAILQGHLRSISTALADHLDRIRALDGVKEFIATRPVTVL